MLVMDENACTQVVTVGKITPICICSFDAVRLIAIILPACLLVLVTPTQHRERWEVLIIFKVERHLFPGSNLNTNTAANVAINRAKMSGTLARQALSLRSRRGEADVM